MSTTAPGSLFLAEDPRALVAWGTTDYYIGRAHLVPRGRAAGLCSMPVDEHWRHRPPGHRPCPECAITWVNELFPLPSSAARLDQSA
ncbi:hypothetical protein SAMN05421810_102270 [Amycolatopsis arida]|uniref:Uncharacterized protein n=1 Tax=Amycolatopsis arida TaxID=587909 RepID=A0A1I5PFW7_9PSEU|nr:hypothetical protein [Amycolatopsis arida]TDX98478.1 hypothetical protein CLV69_101270 [Amycolatopsis arida]SFP32720.1 hypothetical protein SAMN05421810_102270 [Amycolatopsis arida]